MNNRNDRNGRNYTQTRMQNVQVPSRPPDKNEEEGSKIYLFIELMLLILASLAAWIFCSFLQTDYHFEYVETILPTRAAVSLQDEPSERIYEREIPEKKVEPTTEFLEYDFSEPVPECDAYPIDYFNDTIFIGDSRTAGLIMYTKLSPIDCSATGFNLKSFDKKKTITYTDDNGNKSLVSCSEALELYKGKYKSVYISTGVNELGWNTKVFISNYRAVIDTIKEITDVPIYVQLILPVTVSYEQRSENGITNAKQVEFNTALKALIEDEKVFMLDPLPLFSLEDGTLDTEKTYDGAHLEKFACAELLEYYQTHIVDTELYSNLSDTEVAE